MSEYKVIELNAAGQLEVEKAINDLARDRWKLDNIAVTIDTDYARFYTLVFKRTPVAKVNSSDIGAIYRSLGSISSYYPRRWGRRGYGR